MKKIKLLMLLIILLFALNIIANANDNGKIKQKTPVPVNFSIKTVDNKPITNYPCTNALNNSNIKSKIQYYAINKKRLGFALIIAGAVLSGISFLFIFFPGIGLLIASAIVNYYAPRTRVDISGVMRPLYHVLMIPGIILTAVGGVLFIAGLAALVVGILMYNKNRRAQVISDFKDNNFVYGIRIKI